MHTTAGSAVLANAEPPRGGNFDRQFPWSSQLLEQNKWYFKNPSFRGCQEQVCTSCCLFPYPAPDAPLPVSNCLPSHMDEWCVTGHECCTEWQRCVRSDADWGYGVVNWPAPISVHPPSCYFCLHGALLACNLMFYSPQSTSNTIWVCDDRDTHIKCC
jgi:hypothetical protein